MKRSRRPRVLMLLQNNPYARDSRVRAEAQSLRAAGYEVTVICPGVNASTAGRAESHGVTLYQFPAPPEGSGVGGYVVEYGWSMVTMAALSVLVFVREGFDVVHAHNPPDTLVLIGAFYKALGKRFVFDHHDLAPEMYRARFGTTADRQIGWLLRWFERLSFRLADRVISSNESYKRIAITRGSVDPGHVVVVRNGPDAAKMHPAPADPDLRRGAGTVLGYVGIMGPQDGVDLLLKAMHHVVTDFDRPDVLLYVIGEGDMLASLRVQARALGIADAVVFTGWIDPEELPRYLAAVDICIDPDPSNDYNDKCTMIKIMEYMAVGKPIVAFDLPEHRVSAGNAALYASGNDEFDLAQRIVELMDDPARGSEMGAIGRRRIESSLGWDHQAPHLVDLYEGLS